MDARVRVSVCIANYNGMAVLDDCLRSIQAQTADMAVEILLHDDASTDASVAHIQAHYPQVRLITSATNVGFCVANNRMAAQARGDYLLLLNNDAALHPDALQCLREEAERIGKPAILTLPQFDATSGLLVDRGCLLDPFFNPVPNHDPTRCDVAMVIGACLWLPRTLWDELGGFPEWFGSIAEDMYLCCRARLAGYAVRALAVSGYRHWQGMSFGGNRVADGKLRTNIRRRYLSERNKLFVLIVTYPRYLWLGVLPLHLVLSAIEAAALTVVTGNGKVLHGIYMAAWRDMVRHWPMLWRLRQVVGRGKRVSFWQELSVLHPMHQKLRLLLRFGLPTIRN